MNHLKTGSSYFGAGSYVKYKYNEKELQETGMYDYGWRQYMADIAKWNGIDQLSENYFSTSPYAYVLNNAINMFDPDGRLSQSQLNDMVNSSGNNGMTSWSLDEKGGPVKGVFTSDSDVINSNLLSSFILTSGGGNNPTFQFPKGTEEYYKKTYPAFYDLVKNKLPNIVNDPNFLQAFMDITGMNKEDVIKAFTYGQGPILHDYESNTGEGLYDYSVTHNIEDIDKISINKEVLAWFESADRNPNTTNGIVNLFYMSSLVGHEGAHWGSNIKNTGHLSILMAFCNPLDGVIEHGKAFEARMYVLNFGPTTKEKARWGIDNGNYGSNISDYLKYYVKKNQKILSNIFK